MIGMYVHSNYTILYNNKKSWTHIIYLGNVMEITNYRVLFTKIIMKF